MLFQLADQLVSGINIRPTYVKVLFHSSPRQLAGEKKAPAIIIKQQYGFPMSTT